MAGKELINKIQKKGYMRNNQDDCRKVEENRA